MFKIPFGIALVFATIPVTPALAQQPRGAVSGIVVSETGEAPLASARVAIRRMSDSTLVSGVLTGTSGSFARENLPFGTYRLEISTLGHTTAVRSDIVLSAATPRVDLGRIALQPAAVAIQGVSAEGERSPVVIAADRSIYRVQEMPLATGGVATDALRAIPELQVDVDDNITARGAAPQIMLDGRPLPVEGEARIAFLRTLRADRIDRIEYIPNPSARFEAEGQSGIINIVLRRDVSLGLSGSAAANAGTRGTQNISTRLNYQSGALTFFGGALVGFNQSRSNTLDFRENRAATPVTFLQQEHDFEGSGINGGADVTAERKLSARSTVWGVLRGNVGDSGDSMESDFIHMDAGQDPTERYTRNRERDNGTYNFSSALGYRWVKQPQRNEISTELRYSRNYGDLEVDNWRQPLALDGSGQLAIDPDLTAFETISNGDIFAFQVDMARPLNANTRLDVGYRGNFRVDSDRQGLSMFVVGAGSPGTETHNRFHYDEDSNAGYVNLDHSRGKLGVQAGLRVENVSGRNTSSLLAAPLDTDITGLFPSANLSYNLGGGRQLRASYSKRVQRPGPREYSPLNSTPGDPFNLATGNPLLTPAEIHTGSIDASWDGRIGTLRLSQQFLRGSDLWLTTRSVDQAGVSTAMPENVATARGVASSVNGSVRQIGPFSGFVNVGVQFIDFTSGLSTVDSKSFAAIQANANVTATLPHDLRVQATGGFSPRQGNPTGQSSQFRQLNLAFTQRVLQNRAVLTLSVVDPFDLAQNTTSTRNFSVNQNLTTSNRIRRATFTLTYNFGRAPTSNRRVVADDPTGNGGGGGGLGQ